ncbi:hypothetical protein MMC25_006724 [Agyrium rufum]|nr:hypothetical protein [Agyrium rufum]
MSLSYETPSPNSLSDNHLPQRHSPLRSSIDAGSADEYSPFAAPTNRSTPASSIDDIRTQPSSVHRSLTSGVYVPTLAFFDPVSEDLDLRTIATHAVRLARSGVRGLTTQGSNGEAVHLTHRERNLVTSTTRRALNDAGFASMPIIVGCGSQSTRETIELCNEAAESGGDYALVLPPSYYKAAYTPAALKRFFTDVANSSTLPILIYNYPGAVSGTDLDSDTISTLAKYPNIVGCKLTCGNTGKLTRVAAATNAATASYPGSGFMCLGGSADFTLPTLIAGGSGIITGLGNVAPKACVKVFDLYCRGDVAKAQEMQKVVARGDWAAIAGGIAGTKFAMQEFFGYGGFPRRPLPRVEEGEKVKEVLRAFREVVELEKSL